MRHQSFLDIFFPGLVIVIAAQPTGHRVNGEDIGAHIIWDLDRDVKRRCLDDIQLEIPKRESFSDFVKEKTSSILSKQ